jgi:hypothetical protein
MTSSSTSSPDTDSRQRRNTLVVWLVLVPVIIGTLACCGQLALMMNRLNPSADTRSRLKAEYLPWPYSEIPPIDIAAFIEDLQKEQERYGPTDQPPLTEIDEGRIIALPTRTMAIAQVSPTPAGTGTTPTALSFTQAPTATLSPTFTTRPPTMTPTPRPTITPSPSRTNTLPPPPPTPTDTEEPPPPTSTYTQAPPTNTPVTPSPTPVTPSPTDTPVTPVVTTEVPGATPTYAPVRPIAENNGQSEIDPGGQGCLAYFGYRNDNPVEVDIPLGQRNYFSEPFVLITPAPPPSHFLIERVSPAFMVIWNTGQSFIWYLDGRDASAVWCNPP